MSDETIRARIEDALWESLQGQLHGFYVGERDGHKDFDGNGNHYTLVDGYVSVRRLAEATLVAIQAALSEYNMHERVWVGPLAIPITQKRRRVRSVRIVSPIPAETA